MKQQELQSLFSRVCYKGKKTTENVCSQSTHYAFCNCSSHPALVSHFVDCREDRFSYSAHTALSTTVKDP